MTSSPHRLTRTERRKPVESAQSLDNLFTEYLDNHRAYGRSANTIYHYEDSMRLFRLFLGERNLQSDSSSITTAVMRAFAGWIRQRPLEVPRRGRTTRSEAGTV